MANDDAVIVKRIRKESAHGRHGGAWKVAYADFVTAMMAFFLLLWLINTTTPEQKRGIADYFAPQSISQTSSGSGGVLGGRILEADGARSGGVISVSDKSSVPAPSNPSHSKSNDARHGGTASAERSAASSQSQGDNHLARSSTVAKDEQFEQAAESIRQALQQEPDIAELSRQVIVDQTPDGMRIQLVDQDGRPMFAAGSAHPMPYAGKLLAVIAKIIDRLPNRISISGHTAGDASEGHGGMSSWELSAARANVARALVTRAGVDGDRIYEVAGKAGSDPLLPEDPRASANRRLSIVLMKEAPPVPPGERL